MKITTKLYVQAIKFPWEDEFKLEVSKAKMSSDPNGFVVVDIKEIEHTIEIDMPDEKELTMKQIEQLKKMRVQVEAENHVRLQKVDEQIASLMAIESK